MVPSTELIRNICTTCRDGHISPETAVDSIFALFARSRRQETGDLAKDGMTLVERLRNPQWTQETGRRVLDTDRTVADMELAAKIIAA